MYHQYLTKDTTVTFTHWTDAVIHRYSNSEAEAADTILMSIQFYLWSQTPPALKSLRKQD